MALGDCATSCGPQLRGTCMPYHWQCPRSVSCWLAKEGAHLSQLDFILLFLLACAFTVPIAFLTVVGVL
jgi:hypothetical protein